MLGKALQASAHSVPATLSYLNSFIGLISVQSLCLVIGLLVDCLSPPLGSIQMHFNQDNLMRL